MRSMYPVVCVGTVDELYSTWCEGRGGGGGGGGRVCEGEVVLVEYMVRNIHVGETCMNFVCVMR